MTKATGGEKTEAPERTRRGRREVRPEPKKGEPEQEQQHSGGVSGLGKETHRTGVGWGTEH